MVNDIFDKRRTCEQILLTLRQVFDMAIDDGLILKNPCKKIELSPKKPRTKRALNKPEIAAIKNSDFDQKQKTFIACLFYFGLRREEVIALSKSDFDFKEKKLSIDKAIVFDGNTPVLKETKTKSGNRTLDIPDIVLNELLLYVKSIDTEFLFTKTNGELMSLSSYNKFFNGIRKKINYAAGGTDTINKIEGLTAYTFRHNFCTLLYYSNISVKKAADIMGHKDIKMIMSVYAHLDEEKEKTSQKINSIFNADPIF